MIRGLHLRQDYRFTYKNHRGEVSERHVRFEGVDYGSNDFHTEPQFFLHCFCYDKNAPRSFAVSDIDVRSVVPA